MPNRATAMAATVAGTLALLQGCGLNPENGLIDARPLPALAAGGDEEPVSGAPSIETLDRRHWPLYTVEVPIRQIENQPTYLGTTYTGQPAPFPTSGSALDSDIEAGLGAEAGDFVGSAVLPVRAVWESLVDGRWGWTAVRSPVEHYDRAPAVKAPALWRWVAFEPRPPPPGQNEDG